MLSQVLNKDYYIFLFVYNNLKYIKVYIYIYLLLLIAFTMKILFNIFIFDILFTPALLLN